MSEELPCKKNKLPLRDRLKINAPLIEEENGSDFEDFSAADVPAHLCEEKSSIDESIFSSRSGAVIFRRSLSPEPRTRGHFPSWLHRNLPRGKSALDTSSILAKHHLNTVCEEGKCPNRFECYANRTATFLALGKQCTRSCGFCDIAFCKTPQPPAPEEPQCIALSVKELGLQHVVITMVTRDDLPDGGAAHLAQIIRLTRKENPGVSIEVLTSDFQGSLPALDIVLKERPDIFNHNIETVQELSPRVRHKATYERTLAVLHHAKTSGFASHVKSGLMVGLGERPSQVEQTLIDLHKAGCSIVTIGQYLQPNPHKLLVKEFVAPAQFQLYQDFGHGLGIKHMFCGPLVRSSYHAHVPQQEFPTSTAEGPNTKSRLCNIENSLF